MTNRASVKGPYISYYVHKIRPAGQNADHGSDKDFQFFKCNPIAVTQDRHSLKYIPAFWCVNLDWNYLPGRRLSTLLNSVYTANKFKPVSAK